MGSVDWTEACGAALKNSSIVVRNTTSRVAPAPSCSAGVDWLSARVTVVVESPFTTTAGAVVSATYGPPTGPTWAPKPASNVCPSLKVSVIVGGITPSEKSKRGEASIRRR